MLVHLRSGHEKSSHKVTANYFITDLKKNLRQIATNALNEPVSGYLHYICL